MAHGERRALEEESAAARLSEAAQRAQLASARAAARHAQTQHDVLSLESARVLDAQRAAAQRILTEVGTQRRTAEDQARDQRLALARIRADAGADTAAQTARIAQAAAAASSATALLATLRQQTAEEEQAQHFLEHELEQTRLHAAATLDTLNHGHAAHAAAEKELATAQPAWQVAEQVLLRAREQHAQAEAEVQRLDAGAEALRLRLQSVTHHVAQLHSKVEPAEAEAARKALGSAHAAAQSPSVAGSAARSSAGVWRWFGVPLALAGLAAAVYLVPRHLPQRAAPVPAAAVHMPVYTADPGAQRDLKLSYEIKVPPATGSAPASSASPVTPASSATPATPATPASPATSASPAKP